jgi:hypothetical protein
VRPTRAARLKSEERTAKKAVEQGKPEQPDKSAKWKALALEQQRTESAASRGFLRGGVRLSAAVVLFA